MAPSAPMPSHVSQAKDQQQSPPRPPSPRAPRRRAKHGHEQQQQQKSQPLSRRRLWFMAIKPPMYTVAVSPITVGSLAAAADTGALSVPRLAAFVLAAVLIIAWTNLTNDVFDFDTGIDADKPESVVNLLGATRRARDRVLLLANALLLLAFAALASISVTFPAAGPHPHPAAITPASFDPVVPGLIAAAVALGYMYQGPPFRLGYYALGEPITFAAWTLGVVAAYYSQLTAPPTATRAALFAARSTAAARLRAALAEWPLAPDRSLGPAVLLVAVPTTLILLCSHFHQVDGDAAAGKRSPVIVLGARRVAALVNAALAAFAALHVVLAFAGRLPPAVALAALPSAPLALRAARFVSRYYDVPPVIRAAKYHVVRFHFVHGTLVAAAFAFVARQKAAAM